VRVIEKSLEISHVALRQTKNPASCLTGFITSL
jgi:hypothetical protein